MSLVFALLLCMCSAVNMKLDVSRHSARASAVFKQEDVIIKYGMSLTSRILGMAILQEKQFISEVPLMPLQNLIKYITILHQGGDVLT